MVRKKGDTAYVLSFMGYGGVISHFIIRKTHDNRLSMGGIFFNRLCELIAHYSNPSANLLKNEWLLYPVPNEWPVPRLQTKGDEPLMDEQDQISDGSEQDQQHHSYLLPDTYRHYGQICGENKMRGFFI